LFIAALDLAEAEGEDVHAVDAAHMLGIAEPAGTLWVRQLDWHRRAIALAAGSTDPRARGWLGSLLNNQGWTLHDAGDLDGALAAFERALAWREEQGQVAETRIVRWAVARCLRSLGRIGAALAIQERLRTELDAAGADDPYVDEELGECLLALGRVDDARPLMARAHASLSRDAWLAAREPGRIARLAELAAAPSLDDASC
jgi:tetratricopeptide (TPR) repeat protein